MATPYSEIYEWAVRKLEDPELAQLSDDDLANEFRGWLSTAISHFRKCKNDLSDRDDELGTFNIDLLDIEKEILAILVAKAWLTPQLNSALLTRQMFGGKEEKFYSQKEHLTGLENRNENLTLEAQRLHNQYTYENSTYWEA